MTTMDVVQVCDELPVPHQKGTALHSYVDVGGPAANAAITASILGSQVALHSVSREGVLGQVVDRLIDQHAVTRFDHGPAHPVPVSSIWVVTFTGERTILSTPVAGSPDDPPSPEVDLDGAAGVLLDGFYPPLTLGAASTAVQRSIPIVLDCGSWRDVFHELLPLATVAIVSEQFALPGHPPSAESTAAALVDDYGLELAAVSRGERPIVWRTPTAAGETAVPKVQAIDTLGAGDVLHGAFMHFAYHKHRDLLDALEGAAVVASRSCEFYGTRTGVEALVGEIGPLN